MSVTKPKVHGPEDGHWCDDKTFTILQCESDSNRFVLVAVGENWSIVQDPRHSNGYARKNTNVSNYKNFKTKQYFAGHSIC